LTHLERRVRELARDVAALEAAQLRLGSSASALAQPDEAVGGRSRGSSSQGRRIGRLECRVAHLDGRIAELEDGLSEDLRSTYPQDLARGVGGSAEARLKRLERWVRRLEHRVETFEQILPTISPWPSPSTTPSPGPAPPPSTTPSPGPAPPPSTTPPPSPSMTPTPSPVVSPPPDETGPPDPEGVMDGAGPRPVTCPAVAHPVEPGDDLQAAITSGGTDASVLQTGHLQTEQHASPPGRADLGV
jgi:hypothetical protein